MTLTDLLGYVAALCTTGAYAPQVWKVWKTRQTHDISLKAFFVLVTGQSLWLSYGVAKGDWPLIASNAVTLTFTSTILYFKFREWRGEREEKPPAGARIGASLSCGGKTVRNCASEVPTS